MGGSSPKKLKMEIGRESQNLNKTEREISISFPEPAISPTCGQKLVQTIV